jgi:hypothetical protein
MEFRLNPRACPQLSAEKGQEKGNVQHDRIGAAAKNGLNAKEKRDLSEHPSGALRSVLKPNNLSLRYL